MNSRPLRIISILIVLTIALAAMVITSRLKGVSEDMSIAVVFLVLSLVSIFFLWIFMKSIKLKT